MEDIIQFKRDKKQNSNKFHLDKYYTNTSLVEFCIEKTYEVIGKESVTEVIEPSAGDGRFSKRIKNCIAYDIEPHDENVIQQDYLKLDLPYKQGRLVIGNPPYGSRLNLAKAFCNKSFEIAEYVSFILPISQYNNTQSIYKYDLIYSLDLGCQEFQNDSGDIKEVPVCLNIYRKPISGKINKIQRFRDSEIIEIIEIREVIVNNNPKRNRELGDFEYDFAICAWGASIGVECSEGEFAKTFFIKIKDFNNFDYYKNLILCAKWEEIYPMTNTPNLLQWQVYKYVENNKI